MAENSLEELLESVREGGQILRGERKPSRAFEIDAGGVKAIREKTGLSQRQFASVVHVSVKTLRNWEQGVRTPDGAAAALLTAIRNDPKNVLKALNGRPADRS